MLAAAVCAVFTLLPLEGCAGGADAEPKTNLSFAMSTVVKQTVYGPRADEAMTAVNSAFAAYEDRLSQYSAEGDIGRLNAAAGSWVDVQPETAALLKQGLALSAQSEDAFSLTIAPLTLAWGIASDTPRVPSQEEIDRLLPLVDDGALQVEEDRAKLDKVGMGVDLGGIAKGAACSVAADIYEEYGVESALLDIGGNVYARGRKPDGSDWLVGFRDPEGSEESFIASFPLCDAVVAVSGGYERYFEQDGIRYIHIMDPRIGKPAQSDILSVGVIHPDGAVADFYSTTLYVQGLQGTLAYMRDGGTAIALDGGGTLYVSESLRGGFVLRGQAEDAYKVVYVGEEAA